MALNPTAQSNVDDLRKEVSRLGDVLVHDCSPHAERCWCFGAGDVAKYNEAKAALARAIKVQAEVSA